MVNMSYCRFQNTLEALKDCQYALEDDDDELSEEEEAAKKRLIKLCQQIVSDYGE